MRNISFKKLFSAAVGMMMLMAIMPFNTLTAFAAYENTHVNTGNQRVDIVEVAKTQVGYHEGENNDTKYNRWNGKIENYPVDGYGYPWCQCFVSWCANQANISTDVIPKTAGTSVSMDFFRKRGRWNNSEPYGGNYIPQSGDIIFFSSNHDVYSPCHVGIISGCFDGTVYTIEGNSSDAVRERSYSLSNDYIIGYCTPEYKNDEKAPTISILSADKTAIAIGDSITFTASSDYATGFTIGVDNANGRYITQEMPNGSLTLTFSEAGDYSAYVTSYNAAGYTDSERVYFNVWSSKPTISILSADKTAIAIGDSITFTASSDYATGFTIGVDNANGRYITQEMPNGSLTLTFSEAGDYSAYVTSYNAAGYTDSERVYFNVYSSMPTTSKLSANKTIAVVGEEITFTASSDYATTYWIGIDMNGERVVTEQMINGSLTKIFTVPGDYSAYVTSSNALGGVDSTCIYFTIINPKEIISGDMNDDNKIDVKDAVLMARLAGNDSTLKLSDTAKKAADVNGDNIIDTQDLQILLNRIVGKE